MQRPSNAPRLTPVARTLYKQVLYAGRNYPGGLDTIRQQAKQFAWRYRNVQDPQEVEKIIEQAKYIIREIEALNAFHKYRWMRKHYLAPQEEEERLANLASLANRESPLPAELEASKK
jgi:hypothetical protein